MDVKAEKRASEAGVAMDGLPCSRALVTDAARLAGVCSPPPVITPREAALVAGVALEAGERTPGAGTTPGVTVADGELSARTPLITSMTRTSRSCSETQQTRHALLRRLWCPPYPAWVGGRFPWPDRTLWCRARRGPRCPAHGSQRLYHHLKTVVPLLPDGSPTQVCRCQPLRALSDSRAGFISIPAAEGVASINQVGEKTSLVR